MLELPQCRAKIQLFVAERGLGQCFLRRKIGDVSRQVGEADLAILTEHDEPLDDVFELANVARQSYSHG